MWCRQMLGLLIAQARTEEHGTGIGHIYWISKAQNMFACTLRLNRLCMVVIAIYVFVSA